MSKSVKNYSDIISDAKLKIVNKVIENLKTNKTIWSKSFKGIKSFNYVTNQSYHGGNSLVLATMADEFSDPRWMTFIQASDKKLKLKKGSKATTLFYFENKQKEISKEKYEELLQLEEKGQLYGKLKWAVEEEDGIAKRMVYIYETFVIKYFNVFNGEQFENIEKYVPKNSFEITNQNLSDFTDEIIKVANEFIPVKESFTLTVPHFKYMSIGNNDFNEKIVVPDKSISKTSEERFSTLIHELAHFANWKIKKEKKIDDKDKEIKKPTKTKATFGSVEYAREELIAGLTEMFSFQEFQIKGSKAKFSDDNQQAYIKSWISMFNDDPNELFKAAANAENVMTWLKENILNRSLENLKSNKKELDKELAEIKYSFADDKDDQLSMFSDLKEKTFERER